MASLDSLLQYLSTYGAVGATLRGDTPVQMQTPRGPQLLGAVSNAQLERDIREIAPPEAQAQLDAGQSASFVYNGAQFVAQNVGGLWQLQITPPTPSGYNALSGEANTSGQGAGTNVPPQVNGWNWGAFFLPWVWAIGNSVWVGLLALIPCVSLIMRFVMGAKGNEWSWRKRRWNSVADFQSAQKTWAIAGGIVFVVGNLMALPITAAILFPVFARARENARRSACQSHLKQVGLATFQYATSHNDRFPSGTTLTQWRTSLAPYASASSSSNPRRDIFHCPSDRTLGDSYQLNTSMSGVSLGRIRNPLTVPLMWDKDGVEHLDGRNVLFADGHVKWYNEQIFQSQIKPQGQ